jgi:xanthine dehydrogenase YagS FAD-binding subunit
MYPFTYRRADSVEDAVDVSRGPGTSVLAGGTELLNWMRIGILRPSQVLDITRIPGLDAVEVQGDIVRIGALITLNELIADPVVTARFPVLREASLKAASAQLRNLATIGGNPLQFTRCPYFRSERPVRCNKRVPGSGCDALEGVNERQAIFGWTEDCVAVHPSDSSTALAALDAMVVTAHVDGGRRLPVGELHVLPVDDPTAHHVLRQGEIITGFELHGWAPASAYVKVRERESYEYATVSAAVALTMEGPVIDSARIALGSVAMTPWRLPDAERDLRGTLPGSAEAIRAVDDAFRAARPLPGNAHKIPLARAAVLRALETAAARQ